MAPSKTGKAAAPKPKKEKVFHPESRKAGQIARSQLRKGKLVGQASKRGKRDHSQVDKYGFFYHAMPPEGLMTLEDMHSLIKDIWLTRHDDELEEERAARRKGRPKSTAEVKLEERKLIESEEYRTGMEVIDLTHAANVELFRRWDQREAPYVAQLRHIRLSGLAPHAGIVTRPGKHPSLLPASDGDQEMDTSEENIEVETPFGVPLSQLGSTMLTMDGPI
ncbi:hypothetical protein PLICRDRAFT_142685 [Plicaturopsis crispa FD-325 SS-3]|nr:hypothetical protein PLICRDRAFT_142685 [Plicaturopsis crispa FD-325 SS-3]